jgi:hypothetical protein
MQIALKLTLLSLCTSALAATGCTSDPEASDAKLLVNRIWVDKLPKKETDYFELLVLVDDEPVGLFRRASQYEGNYALFRYEVRGDDKLQLLFPQDKSKHEAKYKARACDEKDFDYCLDIDGAPRGVKRYLSRKEWELGADAERLEERLERWRKTLPTLE